MHRNADPQPGLSTRQHYETAVSLHRQGRLAEAEPHYRAVLQTEPDHFDAMEWLGALCVQSRRLDEAIDWLHEAAQRNPGSAIFHRNLGGALGLAERFEEALEAYRRSIALDPRDAESFCDFGVMLSRLGRDEEAVTMFENALALRPDLIPAIENLGYAQGRLGQHDMALYCFERVLAARPGQADAHLNYGAALAALGRHEEAVAQFRKAVAARPRDAHALHNLGNSLSALNRPGEALDFFGRSLAIDPSLADAEYGAGNALLQLGRLQEARARFEKAVALAPKVPSFHRALADARHFSEGDTQLAALEELSRDEASLAAKERIELHFALAKAYDDLQNYSLAFDHLKTGNTLKCATFVYDELAELEAMAAIAKALSLEVMEARRGEGDPSEVPVFVLGMPRSGTTLVEQILASHPHVFGAGELMDFGQVAGCGYGPNPMPFDPASLSGEDLRRLGRRYLDRLLPKAPSAKRITDKLPANFRLLGLIRLALPNARIIHVRRDPADTCFSIYSKLFLDNIGFAYDLGELGRYYKAYEALMAHWRAVLPAGAMLEVQYETLVENFEEEARRIVDYCGLEWDGRCLEFHNTERSVRTASAAQVRQPIYQSSIGRWRPYAERLRPLTDILSAQGEAGP